MNRFKQVWPVLTGKVDIQVLQACLFQAQEAAKYQLARAEEARRLYNECEEAHKQSSDKLGTAIIDDMCANPTKYLP